jgi:signal transduction histidine kinase
MSKLYPVTKNKKLEMRMYLLGCVVVLVEIAATFYTVLGLIGLVPVNLFTFAVLLTCLVMINAILFVTAIKGSASVGIRSGIALILWSGMVMGYWVFAPIYYIMSMYIDPQQLRWVVFSFIWEVPIAGLILILIVLRFFKPIYLFLEEKPALEDPETIYKRLNSFPILIAGMFVGMVLIAHIISTLQLGYFGNLPSIEQVKSIINGVASSILVGVFLALLSDSYLNRARYFIDKKYAIKSKPLNKFTSKIVISTLLIIFAGIGVSGLLSFKSAQGLVRHMVVEENKSDLNTMIQEGVVDIAILGKRGSVDDKGRMILVGEQNLANVDLHKSTIAVISQNAEGVVDDYQHELKTIVFQTDNLGRKIINIIYLSHHYEEIAHVVNYAIFGGIFIIISSSIVVFFYKRSISRTLFLIRKSIVGEGSVAEQVPELATGDEFEELSDAIVMYQEKLRQYNLDLETKVVDQTKELSKQLKEIESKNDFLEQTKKAMVNVLEDAKQLGEDLKKEKAGVELKVEQRTRELAGEHAKLQASINSLPIGFAMTDNDYNIIVMNCIARTIFCPSSGNHAGITKDVDNHEKCNMQEIEKRLNGILDLEKAISVVAKTGKPYETKEIQLEDIFLHIYIIPIVVIVDKKLEVLGSVILVENITEEKVLERAKDEFFSIASHELRTPLTAIRGNTSLIKEYFSEKLKDKELIEMIDDIHTSSTRLISVVNDFLNTSRLDQKRMVFKKEEFLVNKAIDEAIKETEGVVTEKKLYVKLIQEDKGLKALGDVDKLKEVLINLIGNAVKFTKTGGIDVKVTKQNSFIIIAVHDTGSGIAKAQQTLLFRKFQQAESNPLTRDTTQGTGLGLYISRLMMEGMGGQIELGESEVDKGSTFLLKLLTPSNK